MLTQRQYRTKLERCDRCALTLEQRKTWPPRNCPLHESIADLCPSQQMPEPKHVPPMPAIRQAKP